jgi:predicted flavoprotein YhiN
MKNMEYHVSGVNSFSEAQTSTGGIAMDEINAVLESVIRPGVYFTGEMLDIDGQCGGYNLQWAWTSGHIAGLGAAGK